MKWLYTPVLGAALLFSSTAALATEVDVKIFGTIDIGIAHIGGSGSSSTGVSTGGANINRIGFKGSTEELDFGIKASFWLEAGMDPDTGLGKSAGNSFGFNRRATVSLSGDFGELRLGRDDSATFLSTLIFDPFLTNGVGGTSGFAMTGVPGIATVNGGAPIQISNAVSYFLPQNLGGVYGQFQIAQGEIAGSSQFNYRGTRLGWKGGEFNGAISGGRLYGNTPAADLDIANIALAYNFGWIRPSLLGVFEDRRDLKVIGGQLGFTAPMGQAGVLKFSAGHFEASGTINTPAGRKSDWDKISLGYGHNLSKALQLYGTVSWLENRQNGQRDISIQGLNFPAAHNMPAGGHAYGIETGIRLFF